MLLNPILLVALALCKNDIFGLIEIKNDAHCCYCTLLCYFIFSFGRMVSGLTLEVWRRASSQHNSFANAPNK